MPRRYEDEEEYDEEEEVAEEEEEGEEDEDPEEEEEVEEEEEEQEWAYSDCSGKKKALLIGINYIGHASGVLNGCLNDVDNLYEFITTQWGYDPENITVLKDDTEDPDLFPNRENIIRHMQALVEDAETNDALFLHYSGHGSQHKDEDGDEKDGIDEALCPHDYQEAGLIVDDELHDILVKPLPKGCRLTVLFDSCHSGSALDLPYMYDADGEVQESDIIAHAKQAAEQAKRAAASGNIFALAGAAKSLKYAVTGKADRADRKTKAEKTSPADVIFLSGCLDYQTSADAVENGEATGATSHALIKTLSENRQQTYHQLLLNIREILRAKYSQIPQLSSSHPIDTNLTFII